MKGLSKIIILNLLLELLYCVYESKASIWKAGLKSLTRPRRPTWARAWFSGPRRVQAQFLVFSTVCYLSLSTFLFHWKYFLLNFYQIFILIINFSLLQSVYSSAIEFYIFPISLFRVFYLHGHWLTLLRIFSMLIATMIHLWCVSCDIALCFSHSIIEPHLHC